MQLFDMINVIVALILHGLRPAAYSAQRGSQH